MVTIQKYVHNFHPANNKMWKSELVELVLESRQVESLCLQQQDSKKLPQKLSIENKRSIAN